MRLLLTQLGLILITVDVVIQAFVADRNDVGTAQSDQLTTLVLWKDL